MFDATKNKQFDIGILNSNTISI